MPTELDRASAGTAEAAERVADDNFFRIVECTAASLRSVLQFIDPEGGPQIAYEDNSLAGPLVEKVRNAVGDQHGGQRVQLVFVSGERRLSEEFNGVTRNISTLFSNLSEG